MAKFRFRQFQVYKDALQFIKELKEISKKQFPKEEQFGLTSQIWRALNSIVLNIAEGADRGTDKDFAHYLNTSNTSLNEVVACLDIAVNDSYVTEEQRDHYLNRASEIADQLTALRKKIVEFPNK